MRNLKLNNGIEMPNLGIGTFLLSPEQAENSVYNAIKDGYRLIDTATAYCNEKAVGRAIKRAIDEGMVERKDLFVSTKLWPCFYEDDDPVNDELDRLGLDYIDLLFLHQPTSNWKKGYKKLERAYKEGKIKAIGISNFEDEIKEVLNEMEIKPQVIQVECHPYFPQYELRKITEKNDIKIMSWYPLGGKGNTGKLFSEPIIEKLANKYNKSSAQIILKWHTQMGFVVIPGSSNPEHIKQNFDIEDFELTDDDMTEINKLDNNKRTYTSTKDVVEGYLNWHPTLEK